VKNNHPQPLLEKERSYRETWKKVINKITPADQLPSFSRRGSGVVKHTC